MYTYDTVSAATSGLRQRGYTLDFNLAENCLICRNSEYSVNEFEITEVHRFEGNSDPADEATVYAVESAHGEKGILVTGYGISSEGISAEMARKLHFQKN